MKRIGRTSLDISELGIIYHATITTTTKETHQTNCWKTISFIYVVDFCQSVEKEPYEMPFNFHEKAGLLLRISNILKPVL